MSLITAFLLMILTGQSSSEYLQQLLCPYENKNGSENRPRVWCKRDAQDQNCCTGFSFQRGVNVLEQGNIVVKDNGKSFTISVRTLTQGDGVYWCGFMTEDKIIVKLAEDYFTNRKHGDTKFEPKGCELRQPSQPLQGWTVDWQVFVANGKPV
ncbi:hypothetical protein ROHU_023649 [Labeo rohita]|uniref:Uncharacterized protein n=1 Tax=Labeo rohita TaxID=84645 RepID=A0A498L2H1_LABRO|nr:hypothetical protein ROHU_035065 [Labeo rohita]RXN22142.1 hypothetical protein ROHU_023649 [Labeo rohita]